MSNIFPSSTIAFIATHAELCAVLLSDTPQIKIWMRYREPVPRGQQQRTSADRMKRCVRTNIESAIHSAACSRLVSYSRESGALRNCAPVRRSAVSLLR